MELKRIKGDAHYFKSPVNVGAVITEGKILLIDSGNDSDKARKLLKIMESEGLELGGIWNTHSHADHWGGNHLLQERTGCRVWSSKIEAALMNNNIMEPFYLFGAYPLEELKNKFLMAKPCVCEVMETGPSEFMGQAIEVVDLKGHSLGMIGFKTREGVFYVGDALFSTEIIDKYKLLYSADVGNHLRTLDALMDSPADFYVLSHGDVYAPEEMDSLIEENKAAIERVNDLLMEALAETRSLEDLLRLVMERLRVSMNVGQYFLNRSTISAHLSYLVREGRSQVVMEHSRMFYARK